MSKNHDKHMTIREQFLENLWEEMVDEDDENTRRILLADYMWHAFESHSLYLPKKEKKSKPMKLLIYLIIIAVIFLMLVLPTGASPLTLEEYIREEAIEAGVNPNTAVRIARCESGLDFMAKNPSSSGSELYQFLIGTLQWIDSEGLDRFNPVHSLRMFLKYYPKYPHWWECK